MRNAVGRPTTCMPNTTLGINQEYIGSACNEEEESCGHSMNESRVVWLQTRCASIDSNLDHNWRLY